MSEKVVYLCCPKVCVCPVYFSVSCACWNFTRTICRWYSARKHQLPCIRNVVPVPRTIHHLAGWCDNHDQFTRSRSPPLPRSVAFEKVTDHPLLLADFVRQQARTSSKVGRIGGLVFSLYIINFLNIIWPYRKQEIYQVWRKDANIKSPKKQQRTFTFWKLLYQNISQSCYHGAQFANCKVCTNAMCLQHHVYCLGNYMLRSMPREPNL